MDQQGTQIAVAAFADPQQCLLATAGMLAWYQSQPRRQLSAILKIFSVSDGGDQGTRGDRADARDLRQLLAGGVLTVPALELDLQFLNLPVERLEMIPQTLEQLPKRPWQPVLALL